MIHYNVNLKERRMMKQTEAFIEWYEETHHKPPPSTKFPERLYNRWLEARAQAHHDMNDVTGTKNRHPLVLPPVEKRPTAIPQAFLS